MEIHPRWYHGDHPLGMEHSWALPNFYNHPTLSSSFSGGFGANYDWRSRQNLLLSQGRPCIVRMNRRRCPIALVTERFIFHGDFRLSILACFLFQLAHRVRYTKEEVDRLLLATGISRDAFRSRNSVGRLWKSLALAEASLTKAASLQSSHFELSSFCGLAMKTKS